MTTTPVRPLLPLLSDGPHGSRSAMTCQYKCGNACDHPIPNTSNNPDFRSVIEGAIQRRSVLRGAAIGAGALALGGLAAAPAAARPAASLATAATGGWTPVEPNVRDIVSIPEGYSSRVVIAWGDPVVPGAPAFDAAAQTAESASQQFGYNNDFVAVLPLSGQRALLVTNHEYTNEELMFPKDTYTAAEIKAIAIQSHGLSIVEIHQVGPKGDWKQTEVTADKKYNRRITGTTEFVLDGPAVGDPRLATSADPTGSKVLGTLNNCAGGITPWGTILSGEENFNQYFDNVPASSPYSDSWKRYGIKTDPLGRQWQEVDSRFDVTAEPHESFRFGWVVEVDPYSPNEAPVKHTMLGRFKHEGANIQIAADGKAVAYMGDDERGDYIYKFVSAEAYRPGDRAFNKTLLSTGTLYVARFTGDDAFAVDALGNFAPEDAEYDGLGQWVPLTSDTTCYVAGYSVADVLINTRLAADKLGTDTPALAPTKMDRPEDVEPNPVNGKIYAALTNNSDRSVKYPVDEANPLAASYTRSALGGSLAKKSGNRNGYVLEISEDGDDHAATTFGWKLLLVCGEPESPETYFAGYEGPVSPISCPDNVAFDSLGNLWISTDGSQLGGHDGLFRCPVAGPDRGKVQQFLTVPKGAETCGPLVANEDKSIWIAVQHPGEKTGSTFETPFSTWPHTHDFPRPGVVVTWKA